MRTLISAAKSRSLALAAFALMTPGATGPARPVEPDPQERQAAVLKGCVRGGALTNVTVARPDGNTSNVTFRLTGPRKLLKTLKSEHNNHYVEVTGRLHEAPTSRTVMEKEAKVGKGRLTIGATEGTLQGMTGQREVPSIEVLSFRHVSKSCAPEP